MSTHLTYLYKMTVNPLARKNRDIAHLQNLETQMTANSDKRFQYIVETICKTVSKNIYNGKKKYMVKSTQMYFRIKTHIESLNLPVQMTLICDENHLCKKLKYIEESFDSKCCKDCDNNINFSHKQQPTEYIQVTYSIV